MSDVINLEEKRRQRAADSRELWECSDCGGRLFLLTTDGAVICEQCRQDLDDLKTIEPLEET